MANAEKNYFVKCFYDCTVWSHGARCGNTIILDNNRRDKVLKSAQGNLFRGSFAYKIGKKPRNCTRIKWKTNTTFAGEVKDRKDVKGKVFGNTKRVVQTFDGGVHPLRSRDIVLDIHGNKVFPKTR